MTLNMEKQQLRVHNLFDQQCLRNVFTPWRRIVFFAFAFRLNMNQGQKKYTVWASLEEVK